MAVRAANWAAVSAVMGAGVESRELTVRGADGLRMGATLTAPDGARLEVRIPAGSGAGRTLRLKGRGLPARGAPGDLYLVLAIAVPGAVTAAQKSAWAALAQTYPEAARTTRRRAIRAFFIYYKSTLYSSNLYLL